MSQKVVEHIDDDTLKSQYIANRSFNDDHFKKMILEYLDTFETVKRSAIDHLIMPKLSDVLSDKQKKNKVTNLLSALRIEGKIKAITYGTWARV